MQISNSRVLVERLPEKEDGPGFNVVNVQDGFVYTGRITIIPEGPICIGNRHLAVGDTILFAKYSPDTQEIEHDGKKVKFVKDADILAVL